MSATKETKVTEVATEVVETAVEVVDEKVTAVVVASEAPMGFEDEEEGDMIIPRIKVIQTLSPERKDKIAAEGDILNSLTKDKLNGKTFIPVFKFNNNIEWKDRADGGGMKCMAADGKCGVTSEGQTKLCKICKGNEFDNTKQGKDALPKCTKYINFFGFLSGERIPLILSFSKTNYNEGKKLYSLAKVSMQNMWNHGYTLNERLLNKNGNEWFVIITAPTGVTTEEEREFGKQLYMNFRNMSLKFDMEEGPAEGTSGPNIDVNNTEY